MPVATAAAVTGVAAAIGRGVPPVVCGDAGFVRGVVDGGDGGAASSGAASARAPDAGTEAIPATAAAAPRGDDLS
jgi:hypothetical protein